MAEPIQVDFSGKGRRQAPRKPAVIPPERAGLKVALSIVGALLTAAIGYYVMLPPLNLRAKEFYYYLMLVIGSFIVLLFLLCRAGSQPEYAPYVKKKSIVPGIAVAVVALFFGVAWAFSSPFFQAKRYSRIMPVDEDAQFAQDIQEADFSAVPKLDEIAAKAVAGRTLGALADYVSQFVISESNTQINYREKPVRVVGLGYADIIKWLTNTGEGLPGYVIVDMANEKSEFVKLENKIRYTDAEHFGKLLKRHLRFQYPTYMFGVPNFEIDDDGNPFWIAPRMNKTVGLLGGEDIIGIVLVDAVTGECTEYGMDEVRSREDLLWIDRVYSATLLTTQYNYYGKYASGFWNSLLGQRGVKQVTSLYNYIAKDDDVFMYTGVTSATSDNSIIGFILVNQRTKDAVFYKMEGATESSAKEVAQGLVSAYEWKGTDPLLVNVSGQPTYFLSLKDDTDVVQGYSMVNVAQYNKIKVWGKTLAECTNLYVQTLNDNGIRAEEITVPDDTETPNLSAPEQTVSGKITDIRSAVINGNTTYYILLNGEGPYYAITAAKAQGAAVLLSVGDEVTITCVTPFTSSAAISAASNVVKTQ
ncbi:MAG: CvpA family protein [Oscillospiraceae bacterium]|jgi:hypothetical protein|nr:CvpA family protein [Oscillospiraceae bacterium]